MEPWIAALVDSLIFSPLLFLLYFPGIRAAIDGAVAPEFPYEFTWWRYGLFSAVSFAYSVFLLGRYGRTVGMMALHIRVTNLDGSDIGWRKAVLRTAVYLLPFFLASVLRNSSEAASSLISGLAVIGLLWIMVDKAHQGYHDKIARTLVMRERFYQERKTASARAGSATLTTNDSPAQ